MSFAGSTISRPSNAIPETKQKRSLSSTIGSLFNAKGAHVNSFAIELEGNGLRTYGPGDIVSGTVILDVGRPLGVTHVTVSLSGFVDVFKNHRSRAKAPSEAEHNKRSRGNRWTSEYYGDGFASLFEQEVVICGEGRLDPKTYHFQFEIAFPNQLSLPSSIEVSPIPAWSLLHAYIAFSSKGVRSVTTWRLRSREPEP